MAGLQELIREHVALAGDFAGWIEADEDFELATPRSLNLVCFRHVGGDEANQQLLDRLNQSGRLFLTHTKINDRLTLRFSIGQTGTRRPHVEAAWETIRATASEL